MESGKERKVCFIASSGGHWEELMCLKSVAQKYDAFYVTEEGGQANDASANLDKIYTFPQINRYESGFVKHFIRLFVSARKLLKQEKPDVVITTGALIAFPFCLLAKLSGSKVVYIESFARVTNGSLTGKLVYPFADEFLVQWKSMLKIFFFAPEQSNAVLSQIRFFFGDTFGTYYLVIGLGIFILSLYIAGSKYGNIVLGEQNETPKYSFFAWGSMMFTCGLAADILFYSFSEWVLYATDPHLAEMGSIQDWAGVYPLFHWSFIPWGFYLVLAVAFGFMLHVRKRNRQKYSEACRPILGKYTDGWAGRIIDLLAVFALLAGTATTFSVATPLMATIISELFHVAVSRTVINIIILLITCAVYTYSLLHGFKGISKLANICIYMFFGLIAFVLLFGGEIRYIVETGFSSLGRMIQNFVDLSTFTDPLRTSNFPQNWTIYYWAYWMVWCVAAPFFIGSISRGRTVRQTILGGYVFGVGSTLTSFIVLGNYSMGMQVTGKADFIAQYLESGDLYGMIVSIIKTMPGAPVIMVVVLLTMITFYATSFDSIALTASCYSYHTLKDGEQPNKGIQLMCCILLILLPIALLFAESSMNNLQSVSIVAAFPIGVVIVMIAVSFIKDAKKYMEELGNKK